jgi:CRP/FNR family transcriptional regulator, cyclic AMP receptor protein
VPDLLDLARDLPVVDLGPGEVLVREGERSGRVYVLAEGILEVTRAGVAIASIATPGALVGELSALVGDAHTATVTTATPSRLRLAKDGRAFLESTPAVTLLVATAVANRLQGMVAYLADLKRQYAGAPGLDMIHGVLSQLTDGRIVTAEPGSDREPDPLY